MTAILLSALVIAAVAAFLVWWVRYRAELHQQLSDAHGQLAIFRTALRTAGIDVGEPERGIALRHEPPGRHAAKGSK